MVFEEMLRDERTAGRAEGRAVGRAEGNVTFVFANAWNDSGINVYSYSK